jgi:hypothetical protein
MPDREHRVTDNHTWSGVTHDMANPLPHDRLVAMHGTRRTGRLLRSKGTFVSTFRCIGKQLQAGRTKFAAPMMTPTVNFNHETNGSALPVQTFLSLSVITRFINHRVYRLPYPLLQVPDTVRLLVRQFCPYVLPTFMQEYINVLGNSLRKRYEYRYLQLLRSDIGPKG